MSYNDLPKKRGGWLMWGFFTALLILALMSMGGCTIDGRKEYFRPVPDYGPVNEHKDYPFSNAAATNENKEAK